MWSKYWFLVINWFNTASGLFCYNCSSTQKNWNHCGGDFASSVLVSNSTRMRLVNCTGVKAMCFVRSWSARAKHAWLVQRGCYQARTEDSLPRILEIPTRASTCTHEKLSDADYRVCLCQTDWCNAATSNIYRQALLLMKSCMLAMISLHYSYIL